MVFISGRLVTASTLHYDDSILKSLSILHADARYKKSRSDSARIYPGCSVPFNSSRVIIYEPLV